MSTSWFLGLLTLIFIGLKLAGAIAWSCWWVLAPIWIPFGVCALMLLVVFALATPGELRQFRLDLARKKRR